VKTLLFLFIIKIVFKYMFFILNDILKYEIHMELKNYILQSEDISRIFIPVEGFSILASQLISGAFTVVLAVFMRGAPSKGASA
jgi:hypothetical protein